MAAVENNVPTARGGGVTGRGFQPGVSGNPGGRPKGLARRVRELVGDDGHEIAEFMFDVMQNEKARTADRLEAAAWLADRGFGKTELAINIDLNQYPIVDLARFSTEDLETLVAIAERSGTNRQEMIEAGGYRIVSDAAERMTR
jgi:hypothetical protein